MIVPLTGVQYEIEAGQYRATVTELGAGLRELAFRGQPLIAGYEADELPPAGAGQLHCMGGTLPFLTNREAAQLRSQAERPQAF